MVACCLQSTTHAMRCLPAEAHLTALLLVAKLSLLCSASALFTKSPGMRNRPSSLKNDVSCLHNTQVRWLTSWKAQRWERKTP